MNTSLFSGFMDKRVSEFHLFTIEFPVKLYFSHNKAFPRFFQASKSILRNLFSHYNSRVKTTKNSYLKSSKRKQQVRNTFASNLRQQSFSSSSTTSSSSHFTPYPILSPVRSAPGLYWTFSNKLSHVEDGKREHPRINVGLSFQATNFPEAGGRTGKRKASALLEDTNGKDEDATIGFTESHDEDILLWDPAVVTNCSTDEGMEMTHFPCVHFYTPEAPAV